VSGAETPWFYWQIHAPVKWLSEHPLIDVARLDGRSFRVAGSQGEAHAFSQVLDSDAPFVHFGAFAIIGVAPLFQAGLPVVLVHFRQLAVGGGTLIPWPVVAPKNLGHFLTTFSVLKGCFE
jgi:hypothetical protein